jgi:hypothetical protein
MERVCCRLVSLESLACSVLGKTIWECWLRHGFINENMLYTDESKMWIWWHPQSPNQPTVFFLVAHSSLCRKSHDRWMSASWRVRHRCPKKSFRAIPPQPCWLLTCGLGHFKMLSDFWKSVNRTELDICDIGFMSEAEVATTSSDSVGILDPSYSKPKAALQQRHAGLACRWAAESLEKTSDPKGAQGFSAISSGHWVK